nr:MAG: hypothetical protein [Microviridae sp.]
MLVRLYTIMDRVAEDSAPPFAAVNDGVAVRQFRNLIREMVPAEYALYYLGEYNTVVMRFDISSTPVEVVL